ncbi:hypothetical protein BEL04_23645 [Mucilaginibacter sp. PPCGB 2223]|uniref:hypothetical protein n=1 Tax=Mucilaginibacter sp. PPCGB 2223 TaxID=1886027 RepID=UPI0008261DF4|nr:hypothetical protein [Mucilaginibacter sp. PPCGB 2223]OCX50304.1 hypothetical protein BEL04_23645 [Mucilaginibacter sp. PPCGB 2223]
MINYSKLFILLILSTIALGAAAQTSATTSSPYSKYGFGLYQEPLLPQNSALGGLGTAVGKTGGFNDINIVNPATYSNINLTTIDMGAFINSTTLSQNSVSQTSGNFRLNHVAIAIPTGKHAAFSFGLTPYADLGYNYTKTALVKLNNSATGGVDTTTTASYMYTGEGGLSKGYIGYGIGLKNLHVGVNVAYIFGNEKQYRTTQFTDLPSVLNTSIENSMSVGGLNYDYGLQYEIPLKQDARITLGYSGSASTMLSTNAKFVTSQYTLSTDGTPNTALDSLRSEQTDGKIKLPLINRFGITYQKDNKFMIGAEYKMASWSDVTINGTNAGLQNSQTFALGGQITPNINSIGSYWAVVDYRFGVNYDKTYINVNGTDITQYGASIGLGMPIPNSSRTSFYKINFTVEAGQRGSLQNNLVRETFFNFRLGFTINDKWFQKFKFD